MHRSARLGLAVIFVALLATPAIIRRFGDHAAPAAAAGGDPGGRYGFHLAESSRASGLEFVHEAPTLDPKLSHIMPQVASMGAAVAVADVDADGQPDLYVTNSKEGSKNRLYRNRGDGTFEDVAGQFGVADLNRLRDRRVDGRRVRRLRQRRVRGPSALSLGPARALSQRGRPPFHERDRGRRAACLGQHQHRDLARLRSRRPPRLFLGGYYPERFNLWKLADTKIMPESFEYANNGGRKYLYRNLGGGRFEEVSAKVGLSSTRWALAAVAADLRGTGFPDLFIANDYGVSELFINEGGRFREVGREAGVGFAPKSGMNASVGDVLNQGKLAVYVSNISEEGILLQGNNLWVPTGGSGTVPKYENMARAMGVDLGGWSFGAQFGDLNNDGFLDLYLVNGYVSADRNESYWYDYSKVAGGHRIGHRRRRQLACDGHAQPGRISTEEGVGQRRFGRLRRRRADGRRHRSPRRPLGRARRLRRPRGTRRGRGQPARPAAALQEPGPARIASGSPSIFREAAETMRPHRGAATGAPSARRSKSSGMDGSSCRKSRADRASAPRTSGGSISASAHRPSVDRVVIRWPSGKTQELKAPQPGRVHQIQEPV